MVKRESCVDLITPAILPYPETCRQLDSGVRGGRGLQLIRSLDHEYIPVRGEEAVEFGFVGATGFAEASTVGFRNSTAANKAMGGARLPTVRRATTRFGCSRP